MGKLDLLEKEEIKETLSPHVLSFLGSYLIPAYLLIWTVIAKYLYQLPIIQKWLTSGVELGIPEPVLPLIMWATGIILVGVVLALTKIRWRICFLYILFIGGGIGLMWWLNLFGDYEVFLLFYSFFAALIGILVVEALRSSHKYIITNLRLLLRGGIIRKHERTLRYSNISDLECSQGILGRIFNFGSITPITPSGMGTGTDQTFAAAGAGAKLTDKLSVGGVVGGGKGVKVARTRTYWELYGTHPFRDIKQLIENLIQENVSITPVKEQLEVQQQMRDLISQLVNQQTEPKDKDKIPE
jgi:membrane protein YdbS with pleckstrin-like domain